MDEPRFTLIDNETGRRVELTTDELQVALWLAERGVNGSDAKTTQAGNSLPDMRRHDGGNST